VIDGHLRLKGAIAEKMREVPVVPCDGWTDAQVKAFRLMVNRSVGWAEWDLDALAVELGELKALDFDLSLTGFDTREIDSFTLTSNAAEDDVPPLPEVPASRAGDLWLCGPHRVLCGDTTQPQSVVLALGTHKPFLMVTDPPYGVDYMEWRQKPVSTRTAARWVSNERSPRGLVRSGAIQEPVAYIWHAGRSTTVLLEAVGFEIRSQMTWSKDRFALSRGHYHWMHEPCWYAVRGSALLGDRSQNKLWHIKARED
jgi:hypothetical protein